MSQGPTHAQQPQRVQKAGPPGSQGAAWRVPWGLTDAIGVIAVTAALVVAIAVGLSALAQTGGVPEGARGVLVPLPLIVLGVVTLGWVHARFRAAGRLMGPARARVREFFIGIGWGLGAFVAINVVLGLLVQVVAGLAGWELPQPQQGIRQAAADAVVAPWLVVAVVVVAPIAEESFFRGMLFQALRNRLSRWWAIGVSAVVFAGAHVLEEGSVVSGLLIFGLVLPLGAFLAWLFDRRGSLIAPMAVHSVFNLATVAIVLAGTSGGGLSPTPDGLCLVC